MLNTVIRRILSILCGAAVFFAILTASTSLPIYIRPFYYAHIDAMDLPERSGFTQEQIVEAYDEVLDYLTQPGKEFGTGELAYSPDGKAHFEDCKMLFDLNSAVLVSSFLYLVILFLLRGKFGPYRLGKWHASFYGAVSAIVLPLVLGALAAQDFDRAFVVFHSIFFPGKTNWLFDWRTDQIIRVLPQDFFMHCAILIGAGVIVFSSGVIIWNIVWRRKTR